MSSTEPSAPAKPPTDEIPQLSTYTATSEDDRIEGLHLVADSVAQQRQVSSKMLIFHPITMAAFAVVVAIATQWTLNAYNDWLVVGTTVGGITMTFLIFIRWMTGPYIGLAEDIDSGWLSQDNIIVVKWGEDIIGSLVLGWADNDAAKKRGRRRRGKAVIRAWTVKLKYRHKGIGESLLEEAVKIAGEKGADGIVFDSDHASELASFVYSRNQLTTSQTRSASSPPSSIVSWTRTKPPPRKHSRKSPTTRATSVSVRAPRRGAADRWDTHIISTSKGVCVRGVPVFPGLVFFWKIPHARSFRFTIKIPLSFSSPSLGTLIYYFTSVRRRYGLS
jgi:hypothetical protein